MKNRVSYTFARYLAIFKLFKLERVKNTLTYTMISYIIVILTMSERDQMEK